MKKLQVAVCSDWHLSHKVIADKYRTQFEDLKDHEDTLIKNYLAVVNKRTKVYMLGDMFFDDAGLDKIAELPGNKILVMGNHCGQYFLGDKKRYFDVFNDIISFKSYKGVFLSHAPIHEEELRGKFNVHGHCHSYNIKDSRYKNICPEQVGYFPIDLLKVIEGLKEANPVYEAERLQKIEDRFSGKIEMDEMT